MIGPLPVRADGGPVVKICGLRRAADVASARDAGADLIGFVFAPSKRQVPAEQARTALDQAGDHPPAVGVFVDAPASLINEVARAVDLQWVQLSGGEAPDTLQGLCVPYLKTLHLRADDRPEDILQRMLAHAGAAGFVLDSWSPQGGGSGQAADWSLAAAVIRQAPLPVLLAGGLRPDNVEEAWMRTGAAGVDVSSGVEHEGWKDPSLIFAFVQAARRTLEKRNP